MRKWEVCEKEWPFFVPWVAGTASGFPRNISMSWGSFKLWCSKFGRITHSSFLL